MSAVSFALSRSTAISRSLDVTALRVASAIFSILPTAPPALDVDSFSITVFSRPIARPAVLTSRMPAAIFENTPLTDCAARSSVSIVAMSRSTPDTALPFRSTVTPTV